MSPEKQKGGRILRAGAHIESAVNPNSKPPVPEELLKTIREQEELSKLVNKRLGKKTSFHRR